MYVTEKACERVGHPRECSKVVNLYQVSKAGVKESQQTNFGFQEILEVCELVCMRHDGICTVYDSLECGHPSDLPPVPSNIWPLANMQSSFSLMIKSGDFRT